MQWGQDFESRFTTEADAILRKVCAASPSDTRVTHKTSLSLKDDLEVVRRVRKQLNGLACYVHIPRDYYQGCCHTAEPFFNLQSSYIVVEVEMHSDDFLRLRDAVALNSGRNEPLEGAFKRQSVLSALAYTLTLAWLFWLCVLFLMLTVSDVDFSTLCAALQRNLDVVLVGNGIATAIVALLLGAFVYRPLAQTRRFIQALEDDDAHHLYTAWCDQVLQGAAPP